MKLLPVFAAAALAILAAAPASAHTTVYEANLLGSNESPANGSGGTGSARVTLDLDLVTLRVEAEFTGLQGLVTIAHIHCCTNVPLEGNIGVATPIPSFPSFPAGVSAGTYDQTFDLSLNTSYNPDFVNANGGTVGGALNALIAGLNGGRAYFNIHSSAFQGGEIRGFLTAVPEPSTWLLLAVVGVGISVARRHAARG